MKKDDLKSLLGRVGKDSFKEKISKLMELTDGVARSKLAYLTAGAALEAKDAELLEFALESGAPLEFPMDDWDKNSMSSSLLIEAIRNKAPVVFLEKLVECGAKVDYEGFRFGGEDGFRYSALTCAVRGGNVEAVEFLLDSGANPELGDDYGLTPLFLAVEAGNFKVAEALLNGGANVNAVCESGDSILDFAVLHGVQMTSLLFDHGISEVSFHHAAEMATQANVVDALEKIMGERGGELDMEALLRCAIRSGSCEAMDSLIEAGAVLEEGTIGWLSAIHDAARLPDGTAYGILARMESLGYSGWEGTAWMNSSSPLATAAEHGGVEATRFLLERAPKDVSSAYASMSKTEYGWDKALLLLMAGAKWSDLTGAEPGFVEKFEMWNLNGRLRDRTSPAEVARDWRKKAI